MNRTILFLIFFAILGGGTLWYFSQQEEDKTSLIGADRDFRVENTGEVYKIFIADRRGERTTLERKAGHWLYNGQYKARPNAMENLLDAIGRVEMKFKPPRAAVEGMIKSLATEGIKVELYDKKGDLLKAYYVGGATPDERGTYMIMEDAEEPYVVYIPSWEGNLRFRYNLKGNDWRDKTVFAEKLENIQSLSIEYPKQKNKSFRLQRDGKAFKISPFYELTPKIKRPYKRGSAEAFLMGFESLIAEAFETDNPRRDSISHLIPFSIITLTDVQGHLKEVRFHPIFVQNASDPKTGALVTNAMAERYFADCSNGDFMLIQHRVFGKVFWAYDFFFE